MQGPLNPFKVRKFQECLEVSVDTWGCSPLDWQELNLKLLVCSKRQPKWGIVSQKGDQCLWTWLVGDRISL